MSEQSLLRRCPVVPVVVIHDVAHALPLGEALLAGGITVAEITLRTDAGSTPSKSWPRSFPSCTSAPDRFSWPSMSTRSSTQALNSWSAQDRR